MPYSLVWFKRDLRWQDHTALAQASLDGPVRCLYVVEPELWLQPDVALQHFEFIRESLQVLDAQLRRWGGELEVVTGEVPDVLTRIWQEAPFKGLYSHEETGNGFTYARDLKVADWCQAQGVVWHEFPQFGVIRRLKNRDLWQPAWEQHMKAPLKQVSTLRFWRAPKATPLQHGGPRSLAAQPATPATRRPNAGIVHFAQLFDRPQLGLPRRHFIAPVGTRCLFASIRLFGLRLHQPARGGATNPPADGPLAAA